MACVQRTPRATSASRLGVATPRPPSASARMQSTSKKSTFGRAGRHARRSRAPPGIRTAGAHDGAEVGTGEESWRRARRVGARSSWRRSTAAGGGLGPCDHGAARARTPDRRASRSVVGHAGEHDAIQLHEIAAGAAATERARVVDARAVVIEKRDREIGGRDRDPDVRGHEVARDDTGVVEPRDLAAERLEEAALRAERRRARPAAVKRGEPRRDRLALERRRRAPTARARRSRGAPRRPRARAARETRGARARRSPAARSPPSRAETSL